MQLYALISELQAIHSNSVGFVGGSAMENFSSGDEDESPSRFSSDRRIVRTDTFTSPPAARRAGHSGEVRARITLKGSV